MFLLREHRCQFEGDTREMQSSHAASAVGVVFDDPNLIADAVLVPVVALADQAGLPELVTELEGLRVRPTVPGRTRQRR